jgi:hypothetical protein
MFQFLRGIVLIAALTLNGGAAAAEPDLHSANYMMPACRALVASDASKYLFLQGYCAGVINGLGYMGQLYGVCLPEGVTAEQSVSVVIKYFDERPARLHENFRLLALEALQAVWPCKN